MSTETATLTDPSRSTEEIKQLTTVRAILNDNMSNSRPVKLSASANMTVPVTPITSAAVFDLSKFNTVIRQEKIAKAV